MPDPKNRILKVPLPTELYDQLAAAAAADDRELDRYVIRMVRQHLENPKMTVAAGPVGSANGTLPGYPSAAPIPTVFPTAPKPMAPTGAPPAGRVIPLAVKGGGEGVPIDLMSDNALNGEPEELENPLAPKVRVPKPNPNAPDMFGPSHRK